MDNDNNIRILKVYNVKAVLYNAKAGKAYRIIHVVASDVVDAINILDDYWKNNYTDYEVNDWWATSVDEVYEDAICRLS